MSKSMDTDPPREVREFKKYPTYEDSGVERLGEIPEHWEMQRLKFLLAAPLKYGANEPAELNDRDLPRYVRITDIDEHDGLRDETFKSLPSEAAKEYILREGDLLFARSGATAGKTFLYKRSWGKCAYAGCRIRAWLAALGVWPNFVRYFTASSPYWHWVSTTFIQATIQNVSADRYASLAVPLPPLEEQRAIASFLDRETATIDKLRTKRERLIELLQEQRTAIIAHAVTKGLDPKVPMKESHVEWLGKVPAHWMVTRLWRISSAVSGGTPTKDEPRYWGGGIPWVSPKDMKRRFIDSSEDTITECALAESGIKLLEHPAVLIVVRGMILVHTFPVAIATVPVTINQDMKALRFRTGVDSAFMAWLFEGIGDSLLAAVVEEAAHGTRVIRMDEWRSVTVPIPSEPEQSSIVGFLDRQTAKIDTLIAKVREAIEHLNELRTALISAAVTGKIDVRGEVA